MADHLPMLIESYIGALLVDKDLADQVWELWNSGLIDNEISTASWGLIAISFGEQPCHTD